MDPTQEWLTQPGDDLARRLDIILSHDPSTAAILDVVAGWLDDVDSTHAISEDGPAQGTSTWQRRTSSVSWIRGELHRIATARTRSR